VLEGPGFSDGGEVGIGSGVEGLISSRIIGLVLLLIFIFLFILWRFLSRRVITIIL